MRHRFLLWQNKLLLLTLVATFYAYSSYIRVAIRAALEGPAFQWAYFAGVKPNGSVAIVSGQGIYGSFDYVLTAAFLVAWLLWAGLRRPDDQFRAALLAWTSIASFAALWLTLNSTDRLTSGKETLGLEGLSHFWVDVLPTLVAWAFAVALLLRGKRDDADRLATVWGPLNQTLASFGLGCFGLAAVLLNMGQQHGAADFAGVALIYLGLCLILLGLSPWSSRADGQS